MGLALRQSFCVAHDKNASRVQTYLCTVAGDSELVKSRFFVRAFSAAGQIPQYIDISIGEDVFVLG
jgi:hypothetical protein